MVLAEGPKLDETLIAQVDQLYFEKVPVVEGEVVRVDLLLEIKPLQQSVVGEERLRFGLVGREFTEMGVEDGCVGVFAPTGFASGGGEGSVLLLPDEVGQNQEEGQQHKTG
jgi:hypothetical protein